MTNVPDEVRSAWKDLYVLFDVNYNMNGSDKSWEQYWQQATELIKKYGDEVPLLEMTQAIAHMLETMCVGNRAYEWKKGEPYPYPKKGVAT